MWLEFTKSYSGKLGVFAKGTRQDIADKTAANHFVKFGFAKKSCPPWEKDTNQKQVTCQLAGQKVSQISKKLAVANAKLAQYQELAAAIPELIKNVKSLEGELTAAQQEFEKLSVKGSDGKTDKKND